MDTAALSSTNHRVGCNLPAMHTHKERADRTGDAPTEYSEETTARPAGKERRSVTADQRIEHRPHERIRQTRHQTIHRILLSGDRTNGSM